MTQPDGRIGLFLDSKHKLATFADNVNAAAAHSACIAMLDHLQPRLDSANENRIKGIYKRGKRYLVAYPKYKGYFDTLIEAVEAQQNGR